MRRAQTHHVQQTVSQPNSLVEHGVHHQGPSPHPQYDHLTTDKVASDKCAYARITKTVARASQVRELFEELSDKKIYTNEINDIE